MSSSLRAKTLALVALALLLVVGTLTARAHAEALSDDGGAEWRLEQPAAPEPPAGVEAAKTPVGLGRIGDIEFWAPNRGVLITAGNGSTVTPGVWGYNGEGWHEISTVCGASDRGAQNSYHVGDGRIAWAGPNEFWTISDGRPGQAAEALGHVPELEDNTLCRFAVNPNGNLEVLDSYASLAFQSTSYQAMDAAACIHTVLPDGSDEAPPGPSNCWFAGEELPKPEVGAFQLHWNGAALTAEPYLPEGHAVSDMSAFEGALYESVRLKAGDQTVQKQGGPGEEPALHRINPEGVSPTLEALLGIPLLGPGEYPRTLDSLRLSANADALWAAAGPARERPEKSAEAGVTVLRYSKLQYSAQSHAYGEEVAPSWRQVIGPNTHPAGRELFQEDVVNSIAGEPTTHNAWLALDSTEEAADGPSPLAHATLARVSGEGTVSDRIQLPAEGEPYGPRGAAERIVCPAVHDCWMTTTQGWLFHLSTEEERTHPQRDSDSAFSGESLITVRPADEGVPQETSDTIPLDDSGLEEAPPAQTGAKLKPAVADPFATVTLPLLSDVHTRLLHRTTLQLSFRLSVKAKVRLLAKRRGRVVAATSVRVLKAGSRSLLLTLNVHRWPTKLDLQTHALAPLKTVSTREAGAETDTVTGSLAFPGTRSLLGSDPLASGLLP
jgi:hypothetical protein